jgi:hypothetical protein
LNWKLEIVLVSPCINDVGDTPLSFASLSRFREFAVNDHDRKYHQLIRFRQIADREKRPVGTSRTLDNLQPRLTSTQPGQAGTKFLKKLDLS